MDSPLAVARAIAARPMVDLHQELDRVVPAWRALVEHNVVWFVADRIMALSTREERARELALVPEPYRGRVSAVVGMVFAARAELRARALATWGTA